MFTRHLYFYQQIEVCESWRRIAVSYNNPPRKQIQTKGTTHIGYKKIKL
jgi:hypothetical protein